MIYIHNITDAQALFIPRNGEELEGSALLRLKNTIDKKIVAEAVVDVHASKMYFTVAVELPEGLANGEYEYELTVGADVYSCGIIQVGEYHSENKQYNINHEYEQYEA